VFKYQVSSNSFQWEPSCSMRTDGRTHRQTDMTKLIVAFRNFANGPSSCKTILQHINVMWVTVWLKFSNK
jgi:Fe-S-cluster formation regulator IscX/YfhJ